VGARPATFGEFGVAVVDEVLTPRFLEEQLNAALAAFVRGPDWLPEFPAQLRSAKAGTPKLVEDDGYERRFAVTVRAELAAKVGPKALALGIDTTIEVDLTVRVGAFRPAIIGIAIDPVTSDDFRVKANARSEWLPRALLDEGGSRLAGAAQRTVPLLVVAVNRALAASAPRRQVDVLARIRRFQQMPDGGAEPRTGTLGPGEDLRWPLDLAEQERVRLHLWAGTRSGQEPGPTAGSVELTVSDLDGTPVGGTTLAVHRKAPDFDTARDPVTVAATDPAGYLARLSNRGGAPVVYRVEERRTVLPGERIGFAEFGTILIERGIDRDTVGNAVGHQLARHAQGMFAAPVLVRGTATPRLVETTARPSGDDELRFGLSLDIDLELFVGPGANATELTSTLRAEVPLRVSTMVNPASLGLTFEPVPPADLRVIEAPRRVGGRYLPVPQRKLAELLPGHVADELNRRLGQASRRIIAAEVATGPPPGFTGAQVGLRSRTSFRGTASVAEPGRHRVQLSDQQRIRVQARVVAGQPDPEFTDPELSDSVTATEAEAGTDPGTGLAAELAVCDEHGGVWATDRAAIPDDGGPVVLDLEFHAPEPGQWRLRMTSIRSSGGTARGVLDYELQVSPLPAE
jgi:hypothetical protein